MSPRKKSINPVFQKAVKWLKDNPTDPDQMTDDQIGETEVYTVLGALLPVDKRERRTEFMVLRLARETIKESWKEHQKRMFEEIIQKVFAKQESAVGTLTVTRDEGTGIFLIKDAVLIKVFEALDKACNLKIYSEITLYREGKYKPKRLGRPARFAHRHYAMFAGQGSSEDERLEAAQLFEDHGQSAPDFKGGFLLLKRAMRKEDRNGVFELVIEKGDENNARCSTFSAKLYQYPFISRVVPVISFPPASGDKNNVVITDQLHETPSMASMIKDSILMSAQTPAVVFGLVEALRTAENTRTVTLKLPKGTAAFG